MYSSCNTPGGQYIFNKIKGHEMPAYIKVHSSVGKLRIVCHLQSRNHPLADFFVRIRHRVDAHDLSECLESVKDCLVCPCGNDDTGRLYTQLIAILMIKLWQGRRCLDDEYHILYISSFLPSSRYRQGVSALSLENF